MAPLLPPPTKPRPRARALVAFAPAALLLAGCLVTSGASSNAVPLVRAHAESDLDCPQNEIRVVQKLGGRFEAIGCGRKAAYLTACDTLQCVVDQDGHPIPWHARPDPVPQSP